jgi:hypothetical protein
MFPDRVVIQRCEFRDCYGRENADDDDDNDQLDQGEAGLPLMFKATHDVTPFNGPQPKVETIFRAAARPAGPDSGTKAVMTNDRPCAFTNSTQLSCRVVSHLRIRQQFINGAEFRPFTRESFTLRRNLRRKTNGANEIASVPKSWQ